MINYIFGLFIVIGIVYSMLTGNTDVISREILTSSETAFKMTIQIFAVMSLWLGIMNIASSSGLLKKFTSILKPILKRLFPSIPNNHESLEYISTNMVATMFGLGNAATPLGLKAMESLKELNNKDEASEAMITFLIINTAGFTLIPTTIISLRMASGSNNPTLIISLCLISSFLSLLVGLLINYFFRKRYR